jgi:hypothetical protein
MYEIFLVTILFDYWLIFVSFSFLSRKWTSPSRGGGPSAFLSVRSTWEATTRNPERFFLECSSSEQTAQGGPAAQHTAGTLCDDVQRFYCFSSSSVRCIFFLLWHSNSITSENHILKNAHNPCSRMRNHGNVDTQPLGRCYELLFLQRPCRYHSIVCVGLLGASWPRCIYSIAKVK